MEAAQSLRNRLSVKHFLLRNRVEFPILRGGDQEAEKAVRGTHRDERSETSMSTGVHLMGGNGKQPSKQPASHDALIEAIAKGERLLVRLEGEQQDARARLVRDTGFRRSGNSMRPSRQTRNATGSSSMMSSRRSRKGARRSSSQRGKIIWNTSPRDWRSSRAIWWCSRAA